MGWLESVFGAKPEVAKPRYTKLPEEQQKAIDANIAAMPSVARLGDLYSEYLQGGIERQLPGFRALGRSGIRTTQTIQDQAQQLAEGQIPQDVQDRIMRSGAYQNLLSGGGGSFLRSLQARDIGRTSLDLISQGAQLNAAAGNSAQLWDRIASGTLYDPSRMYITPAQEEANTAQNNLLRQNFQQAKYNVAAAPTPFAKGVSDTLIGLIGAYLGAGRGGGGSGLTQPADPYSTNVQGYAGGANIFGHQFGGEPVYGSTALPYDSGGYQPVDFGGYQTSDYGK